MVNTSTPFLVNLKLHNEVSWFIVLLLIKLLFNL